MQLPRQHCGRPRAVQVTLLIIAWSLAAISIPTPAEDKPVILLLFPIPVGLIIGASFLDPFYPGFRSLTPVPVSAVLLLLTPLVLMGRSSPRRILVQRIASIGLLGSWAFPIVVECFVAPQDRHLWGFQHVAWGYYIYAVATTIAFIAIQIGPRSADKIDGRHGFPVVPRSGTGRPRCDEIRKGDKDIIDTF